MATVRSAMLKTEPDHGRGAAVLWFRYVPAGGAGVMTGSWVSEKGSHIMKATLLKVSLAVVRRPRS
jgi:hypothetical protein